MTGSSTSEFRHLEVSINGESCVVPLAIDDEEILCGIAVAANLVNSEGGFRAVIDPPEMIAQVQLIDVPDEWQAVEDILASREWLLQTVDICHPELVRRGGGARSVRARTIAPGRVAVHIVVDCCRSTGAHIVNEIAACMAPALAQMTGARLAVRILTNIADTPLIRVHARIRPEQICTRSVRLAANIAATCELAEEDAGRAAVQNRDALRAVTAVILASGNDWRAVETGAHAYAARTGGYRPLARWDIEDDGSLVGQLIMPVSLGAVATELAQELAAVAGSVGLAANLAGLIESERPDERRATTKRPGKRRADSHKGLPGKRQDTTRPFVRAS